uniref:Uncharacterized protein n=1 Tax=Trypanosoma vivax (strain Y486) TaxID=1055687 RepID=G0TS12_TRYVY|nr:conserved hypothetical protein, fragment [Trypanosoma vivax Y486]
MEERRNHERTLVRRHAFGVKADVHGCIAWVEEGTLIYPIGKTVALHNLNTNTQRFLETSQRGGGITALAVSPNRKFIAIAECGPSPQVQIFDSVTRKRRKVLTVLDLDCDRFTALDFSSDGRHLVTQGGAPHWRLFFWNWERSKPLAFVSVVPDSVDAVSFDPNSSSVVQASGLCSGVRMANASCSHPVGSLVTCVTICPHDPLLIGVSGYGFMRFYRYVDGVLRLQSSIGYAREGTSYFLTHAWVEVDRVVASTQSGELLLIEGGIFKRALPVPPAIVEQTVNPTVITIVSCKLGFVVGSDQGTVAIYECKNSLDGEYSIVYSIPVPLEAAKQPPQCDRADGSLTQLAATSSVVVPCNAMLSDSDETSSASKVSKPMFRINKGAQSKVVSLNATLVGDQQGCRVRSDLSRSETRRENSVIHLALDSTEETMVLVTFTGQILAFDFTCEWSKRAVEDPPSMLHICQSFHVGGIIGLDCSVKKPFLVTSGVDKSVRIWNTNTHRLEICEFFSSPPGAVAIHPNGLYLVLCFPDKVRVMSVLWNGLHEYRVISLRNVTDVKYSVGGTYFALAHGNIIHIYNSLTCDVHGQLRGHPQKINSFQWCATSPYPTDNAMISTSLDGLLINWNITEMRKETEYSDKRYQYRCITADNRNVWAVSEPTSAAIDVQWKSMLRELDRYMTADVTVNNNVSEYEFFESKITSITFAPKQRMLFGGMEDGSVKFMPFPLQLGVQETPIVAHMGPVVRMVLSHDEATLYTVSSDGTLFIFDAREDGRPLQRDLGYYSDDVLVLANEVEERDITIESLRHLTEKLRTDIEGEEKRRSHEQSTRLRERADEFKSELDALETEYAALWNAKAEQERSFVAVKLQKESEAAPQLEDLEREGQTEVQRLEDLCAELQHKLSETKNLYAEEVSDLMSEIEQRRCEDQERFKDVVSKREKGLRKLEQIKQTLNHMKDFETYKSRVKTDVGELAPAMQDPAKLREVVDRLYQRHVVARDGQRATQVNREIKDEFKSQVEYLSTSVEALRRKCKVDQEQHRCEVSAMMMENLSLIREIHNLRKELADLRNASISTADEAKRQARIEDRGKVGSVASRANLTALLTNATKLSEKAVELEENRKKLQQVRTRVDVLQRKLAESREKTTSTVALPPL